jgi:hypothetical protein
MHQKIEGNMKKLGVACLAVLFLLSLDNFRFRLGCLADIKDLTVVGKKYNGANLVCPECLPHPTSNPES